MYIVGHSKNVVLHLATNISKNYINATYVNFFDLSRFMIVLTLWMITASQQAESKVVTANNHGVNSTACCVDGSCPCSSLSFALENINNNTIINITSESVVLNTTTPIGSGNLHNITITGNGATIMCNNSGDVYCESCSDIIIEGITWDMQCGDPNKQNKMAEIYLAVVHNIKIERCIFRGSQVCALDIYQASSNIAVRNTTFSYNFIKRLVDYECSGLKIIANNDNVSITILNSSFVGNRHINSSYNPYGLSVHVSGNPESHLSLTIIELCLSLILEEHTSLFKLLLLHQLFCLN